MLGLIISFELGILVGVGIMCFFQAGKEGKEWAKEKTDYILIIDVVRYVKVSAFR